MSSKNSPRSQPVGVDAGASLIKIAAWTPQGKLALESLAGGAYRAAAARLLELAESGTLGAVLTGCGAKTLGGELQGEARYLDEFEAWGLGARHRLAQVEPPCERFLLVSLGTGTSALLVEAERTRRVGGTALGGGTLLGLAGSLLGTRDFGEILELARQGDRGNVDLLVEDLYPEGLPTLPGALNAASFGKLAQGLPSQPADRAHALLGLLGENVALLASTLAAQHDVTHVAFGGGVLRDNVQLRDLLVAVCRMSGQQPLLLEDGEYTGALGALVHAGLQPSTLGAD